MKMFYSRKSAFFWKLEMSFFICRDINMKFDVIHRWGYLLGKIRYKVTIYEFDDFFWCGWTHELNSCFLWNDFWKLFELFFVLKFRLKRSPKFSQFFPKFSHCSLLKSTNIKNINLFLNFLSYPSTLIFLNPFLIVILVSSTFQKRNLFSAVPFSLSLMWRETMTKVQ